MCGIIGYVGPRSVTPLLIEGLKRMEYRGYDSAGVAVIADGALATRRAPGKIAKLEGMLASEPLTGHIGIGHTRWATHGGVTDANAHPHCDASGRLCLVHNGVIENFRGLKSRLEAEGYGDLIESRWDEILSLVEAASLSVAAPDETEALPEDGAVPPALYAGLLEPEDGEPIPLFVDSSRGPRDLWVAVGDDAMPALWMPELTDTATVST